jgi:two-component system sensor histidine kinase PilS (NtrC family)
VISYRKEILEEVETRRLELNVGLLRVYNYYRVLVGIGLLTVSAQTLVATRLGLLDPTAFFLLAAMYILSNLTIALGVPMLPQRTFRSDVPAFVLVVFDVLFLTTLTYYSQGVASGLGVLILVAVAIGSILVTSRLVNLVPALATLAVLYEEFYLSLSSSNDDFFQAGILGGLYFTAA